MEVCLAYGTTTKPLGMFRNMMITIERFELKIEVIVTKDNKDQNIPLILGRSFLEIVKSLVDL